MASMGGIWIWWPMRLRACGTHDGEIAFNRRLPVRTEEPCRFLAMWGRMGQARVRQAGVNDLPSLTQTSGRDRRLAKGTHECYRLGVVSVCLGNTSISEEA